MLSSGRRALWLVAAAFGLFIALLAAPQAAMAQDCQTDLQKLTQQREAQIAMVNGLVKAAKGKPLDPNGRSAPRPARLNAVEATMIAYMVKNKDWCSIPDDVIDQLKANHAKSVGFTAKACNAAAQHEKDAGASGAGRRAGGPQVQPLPTGPL